MVNANHLLEPKNPAATFSRLMCYKSRCKKLYKANNMILFVNSDGAYLIALLAQSQARELFYIGKQGDMKINGPI